MINPKSISFSPSNQGIYRLQWLSLIRNQTSMARFGAFVVYPFGKMAMSPRLLVLRRLLFIALMSKVMVISQQRTRAPILLARFRSLRNLYSLPEEGFVSILPTSSTFHVCTLFSHLGRHFFGFIMRFCGLFRFVLKTVVVLPCSLA